LPDTICGGYRRTYFYVWKTNAYGREAGVRRLILQRLRFPDGSAVNAAMEEAMAREAGF
jgi:hypothetical protein